MTLRAPESSTYQDCTGHYPALVPSGTTVKLLGSLPALSFTIILDNWELCVLHLELYFGSV